MIARVYGLTNEVQKCYMTKCIGDTVSFLLTVTRKVYDLTVEALLRLKYWKPEGCTGIVRGYCLASFTIWRCCIVA